MNSDLRDDGYGRDARRFSGKVFPRFEARAGQAGFTMMVVHALEALCSQLLVVFSRDGLEFALEVRSEIGVLFDEIIRFAGILVEVVEVVGLSE